jgi:hypothetical protein
MNKRTLATIAAALLIPCTCFASPLTDALSKCLADNSTGKDRKDLAKWIFVGVAAHPEMKAIAVAEPKSVEIAQRTVAELFTKLIGTSCANEMRIVIKEEGSEGARVAFEYLGKMAMQELMGNKEVNAVIGGFERYVDQSKLDSVLRPK